MRAIVYSPAAGLPFSCHNWMDHTHSQQEQAIMATRMRYLAVSALCPGMVLAKPLIITEHGRVLLRLPAGQILAETGIEQMRVHHAEYACIEETDLRTEAEKQSSDAQQDARLRQIFRFADRDAPRIRAFYNALLAYRKS